MSDPSVGELLRRHRFRVGLTQRELAELSRVSLRTVRYIEQGQVSRPQAGSVRRLADALGLSAADLAGPPTAGAPAAVRVGVLGPLVLWRDGAPVPVASARVRTLLGLLAVQVGHPVGGEEIVDVVWGEDPPRTCTQLVHTYVATLRRLLEPGTRRAATSVLRRSGTGYLLELDPDGTDLGGLRRLTQQAERARLAGDEAGAHELTGRALAAWRGVPLAGCGQRLDQHPAVIALRGERLALALAHADLALALGAPSPAVPLRALLNEEPLHEALAARLMLALAADGQQAAALAVFDELRHRLDTELGLRPGAELRAAQLRVLRGAPAPPDPSPGTDAAPEPPVPAQLPPDVAGFTGREEHLTLLDRRLSGNRPVLAISTVDGMPGVGKTALAVHWAHRVRDSFPDGQLYVDLSGHAGGAPMRPVDALVGFLLALGVPAHLLPDDQDRAAALYRSTVAGKRLLVVLDNAVAAEQVRPLLPGTTGSVVLVTSRSRIAGLVARDGAAQLTLGVLAPAEAVALLRGILGGARADAEPEAVERLAHLCAYLPLALRIAAANLVARPRHRVADHVARLDAGNRLAMLSVDGDAGTAVRATFDLSYAALPEGDRRAFRLMGTVPGPDVGLDLVVALTGGPREECERRLARLVDRNLLDEPAPGRYAMHDLVRLYAAERCPAPEREHAVDAVARFYGDAADAASRALNPHLLRLPVPVAPAAPGPPSAQALAWLDAERDNLVATVEHLAAHGRHEAVSRLADALQAYLRLRVNPATWQTVCATWLAAARAQGDPVSAAAAELSAAVMENFRSRYGEALAHLTAALRLAEAAGWTECAAVALNNLARVHWLAGRTREAIDHFERALVLHRRAGRVAGEAVTLANLGAAHGELARSGGPGTVPDRTDLARARDYLRRALELHRRIGDLRNETETLRLLAEVHRDLGDHAAARDLAGTALRLARGTEDRLFEVTALNALASIEAHLGDAGRAAERYGEALRLARTLHDRQLEAKTLLDAAETELLLGRRDRATALLGRAGPIIDALGLESLVRRARRVATAADPESPRRANGLSRGVALGHPGG